MYFHNSRQKFKAVKRSIIGYTAPMTLKRYSLKFIAFFIGCYGCFMVRDLLGLSPVVSSAIVGLLGTLIPLPSKLNKSSIYDAIYCGSFAGMCSAEYLNTLTGFIVISAIGSLVYLLCVPHFKGHGGKFGSMAFVTFLLFLITKRNLWTF